MLDSVTIIQEEILMCLNLKKNLGKNLCSALPGFHSFHSLVEISSFMCKGKVQPLRHFPKLVNILISLKNLVKELQAFVCAIYGRPNLKRH